MSDRQSISWNVQPSPNVVTLDGQAQAARRATVAPWSSAPCDCPLIATLPPGRSTHQCRAKKTSTFTLSELNGNQIAAYSESFIECGRPVCREIRAAIKVLSSSIDSRAAYGRCSNPIQCVANADTKAAGQIHQSNKLSAKLTNRASGHAASAQIAIRRYFRAGIGSRRWRHFSTISARRTSSPTTRSKA
jgi:hypothetical protein